MPTPIDFYFDFSSPFGYLAACRIDTLAEVHDREARWRPYLMGVAFKATGRKPIVDVPMVGAYSRRDIARSARLAGEPLEMPEKFPIMAVAPSRAFYWVESGGAGDAPACSSHDLALALFRAYFVDGRDISDVQVVAGVGAEQGLDAEALAAGMGEQAVKDRLREETDAAIARGVFGSPFVIVDGEPFWGHDRLPQVVRWLETGGW